MRVEESQAMLEREQMLEEALMRAERNQATEDDWKIIYFECGKQRKNNVVKHI